MTNAQRLADLATLGSFLHNPQHEHADLEGAKAAAGRLHQYITRLWEQSQEESTDPEMSFQESQFFARETQPDTTPDDHAFGSDTDLRTARWQQQQPHPPEPDDWNSPRI